MLAHILLLIITTATITGLCSCSGKKAAANNNRSLASQVSQFNRASGGGQKNVEMASLDGYAVPQHVREKVANSIAFSRSEDVVWTTPDQQEESLSNELLEILTREKKDDGPWLKDYERAVKRAQYQGKPILIWFTDSQRSALCKKLGNEIFGHPKFEKWAQENVIKITVDAQVGDRAEGGEEGASAAAKYRYHKKLRDRYKVHGYPTVILQLPDGRVVRRLRGFGANDREVYFGNLRGDVKQAQETISAWRSKLISKGYREWQGAEGQVVFCKPVGYKNGIVSLVDPVGKRMRVNVKRLSAVDREWLERKVAKP